MPDYASPLYWQERYAHDPTASFDWYLTYDHLKPYLAPILEKTTKSECEVFIPGCGNSPLSAHLYADGLTNISNVDISSVVISQVQDRNVDLPEMDFSVLDVTDMKDVLPEACFDLVRPFSGNGSLLGMQPKIVGVQIIDKALMDSILCGEDALKKVGSMIEEMHRVLKPGGHYVVVSFGSPSTRLPHLQRDYSWDVSVTEIPKPKLEGFKEPEGASTVYYLYICKKSA